MAASGRGIWPPAAATIARPVIATAPAERRPELATRPSR